MKKIFALVLAFAAALALVACGGGEQQSAETTAVSDQTKAATADEFVFKSGDVEIAMNAPAADIISALGEPISYFESESCAFKGLDKTYTYTNFVIYTYPKDGVDYILEVSILNDLVKTAEGISIGDTAEMVKMAYGEAELDGTSYSYTKGESGLLFIMTDEKVSSIQYFANIGVK